MRKNGIWQSWKEYPVCLWMLIGYVILGSIYSILSMSVIPFITYTVRELLKDASRMTVCIIQISLLLGLQEFCKYFGELLHYRSGGKLFTLLTDKWNTAVLYLPYRYFESKGYASIMHAEGYIGTINRVGMSIAAMFCAVVSFISSVGVIVYINWVIALIVVGCCLVFAITMKLTFKKMVKYGAKAHKFRRDRSITVEDGCEGQADAKLHGITHYFLNKAIIFNRKVYRNMVVKRTAWISICNTIIDSLPNICLIGIILMTVAGKFEMADFAIIITMLLHLSSPIVRIFDILSDIGDGLPLRAAYEDALKEGYAERERVLDPSRILVDKFRNMLRIRIASFAYKDNMNSLHDVFLDIQKGEQIGIVGPSGSGKSTLAKIILGFLEPDVGDVLIDGISTQKINNKSLRSIMCGVLQETHMFTGSIKYNISFGDTSAKDEAIEAALIKAGLEKVVNKEGNFKDGIYSKVGHNGLNLSGGERQRIALARLFYHNPQIIVLDEATSALDNRTERLVQDAINSFKEEKKTVIIIAHRLTTIQHCDQICVVKDGTIVQRGSWDDLVNDYSCDEFRKLLNA